MRDNMVVNIFDLFIFLAGGITGGITGWYFYFRKRRQVDRLEEEKLMLVQEKQLVLDFMHNLAESVAEGLNREELMRRVVHAAVLSTGALSAAIYELTPEKKLKGTAVEGLFPPQRAIPEASQPKFLTRAKHLEAVLRSEELMLGEGIIGLVAQTGQAELIANAEHDPRVRQHKDSSLRVHSLIVAPMHFRQNNIGVLAIANSMNGLPFNETDLSLAKSLAEQAAIAIHNLDLLNLQLEKKKIDMDLSVASSVQNMLLPRQVNLCRELDIDAVYVPAQKVGGDLYDVFSLPGNKIGFAVADVSGKGISASLLMAICQSNLRHLARSHHSPAAVLTELNSVMYEEMQPGMFVTMIYGLIDVQNNELIFARAGHELPLICHQSENALGKKVCTLMPHSEGMALGMVPTRIFRSVIQDKCIPFSREDICLLYTDGLTESLNPEGTQFSSTRLSAALTESCLGSAAKINQDIIDCVKLFCGQVRAVDDLTVLTIKRIA